MRHNHAEAPKEHAITSFPHTMLRKLEFLNGRYTGNYTWMNAGTHPMDNAKNPSEELCP